MVRLLAFDRYLRRATLHIKPGLAGLLVEIDVRGFGGTGAAVELSDMIGEQK